MGAPLTASAIGNRYMFTGREWDEESSIYYYRARMYDPKIGRFLQRDPLGYVDSLNLYSYAGNNSVNFRDPSGKQVAESVMAVSPEILMSLSVAVSEALTVYLENNNICTSQEDFNSFVSKITLYLLMTNSALTAKMSKEISRLLDKVRNLKLDVQYTLRAASSGWYPDYNTGKLVYLEQGEIWKIGETTNPGSRYSQKWLKMMNLYFQPEWVGDLIEVKITEKAKIYAYFFQYKRLPPGNRIFR